MTEADKSKQATNFIKQIIEEDIKNHKNNGAVVTRFPPEPNGFLHIGHAKSICLNFGLAAQYKGKCHLRFDDTNPIKEDELYVQSIKNDVKWLGFDWGKNLFHASDYFQKLYEYAVELIKLEKAFVCQLTGEEMRQYRGSLTQPGQESPYRGRSVKENLDLFERMKKGDFEEGSHVLRAKIDMSSPNINMRDPVMYRVRKETHQMTGDAWCIYPMYDYAHCISDMLEGITHSICTLEFEDHRPLYDWFLDTLKTPCHPQQIEFARLNLNYTVMSKRKLLQLVEQNHVNGWEDPRMPTIAGMRKRGYPAAAIRQFCDRIGVGKKDTVIDVSILEDCVRDELNESANRVMGVLDPLKVTITNYPDGKEEIVSGPNHPAHEDRGRRDIPFSKEIYIEREDFLEEAPKKFFRLSPGKEVRLRYAYIIKCDEVIKDTSGKIIELRCSYDPDTLGKNPEGRKVKGIIHWVSQKHAVSAEVHIYDRLFKVENPDKVEEGQTFLDHMNPDSHQVIQKAYLEPSIQKASLGHQFQLERLGYFCINSISPLSLNRTATLRDTWARIQRE